MMTNCYNIEKARITQCDRNEESKRSYLSKRRPISPSRIKLKYLAKQQQQSQNQQESHCNEHSSRAYGRQSSQPNESARSSYHALSSAKSMEWHVREDDNRHSQPNYNDPINHCGSISKAKSIDYLSSSSDRPSPLPAIRYSTTTADEEISGAASLLMITNNNNNNNCANQKRLSGSTFTVFGDPVQSSSNHSSSYYDDGDSGILVNDSGQCSILSDVQSMIQARDELKTVYLRKSKDNEGKSFGLLISQFARSFETDHNRFRVRHVLKNSEADLSGEVQVGDEIITVNDVPAIEQSFDQMQDIINAKTVLRLVLQRGRATTTNREFRYVNH